MRATDSNRIQLILEMKMITTSTPANRFNPRHVEQTARRRLARTGYPRLKAVECSFRDGRLTLRGNVPSYHHKQIAQEALRQIFHVIQVVNNLEVSS